MASTYLLAIDQGTTSSRAMLFDKQGQQQGVAQKEFEQFYPKDGWVEHDAAVIWQDVKELCQEVVAKAGGAGEIAAIGITNQRETCLLWDRATGEPIGKAIVWQDRRTADFCYGLKSEGMEGEIQARTGLLADPYFSATKLMWMLDNIPSAREKAEAGLLAFGTMDCWILWNLTGGQSHATDITNASRTMLCNIHTGKWDAELLKLFRIPESILPEIKPNVAEFGVTDRSLFGAELPITGMAGDQQAAAFGQACFKAGMMKSTYGTGCFALMNIGARPALSKNRLLTTVAYEVQGQRAYALEGAIFNAGTAIQWLRDGLKIIEDAKETEAMAEAVAGDLGVYFVPAFTGLGAPYWEPEARGAIVGLTRNAGRDEIARAALEAVAYQTRDLMEAMQADAKDVLPKNQLEAATLRVDGGMVRNNWLMQFLANQTNMQVDRPTLPETTVFGAACLAGLGCGWWKSPEDIQALWQKDQSFTPNTLTTTRETAYKGWQKAVKQVLASV